MDPKDPDDVFVAAFGHAFGPNPDRGVYRSRDGGATWKRVLFVDDSTGAIDLAMDPTNPRILYASMWRFQRFPWGFSAGGGKSGLWKSTDGGDTWTELTDNPGMPRCAGRAHRRLGVRRDAEPRVRLRRDLARRLARRHLPLGELRRELEARERRPGLHGAPVVLRAHHRRPEGSERRLDASISSTYKSIDGGHTFQRMRVPHGDDHLLWIDPQDPNRMIEGNDGGATISLDGGENWSSQDNQPTAQFYHVLADDRFPVPAVRRAAGQLERA